MIIFLYAFLIFFGGTNSSLAADGFVKDLTECVKKSPCYYIEDGERWRHSGTESGYTPETVLAIAGISLVIIPVVAFCYDIFSHRAAHKLASGTNKTVKDIEKKIDLAINARSIAHLTEVEILKDTIKELEDKIRNQETLMAIPLQGETQTRSTPIVSVGKSHESVVYSSSGASSSAAP